MTRKNALAGFAALSLFIGMQGASHAQLVINGSFELTSNGNGQQGINTNLTGWSTNSNSYNFVYAPGTADTTGAPGQYGNVKLWGPGDGSANGLPAASPDGGNFIASDGAFQIQPLYQTINGLKVGHNYSVSFYWAAAQQYDFNGATTDQWVVSLGNESHSTAVASIASHGFSGWKSETFNYIATSTSEALSFLANGTPQGVPPFALLDGVKMADTTLVVSTPNVPEPTAIVSMCAGIIGFGVFARRRLRAAKSVS